MSITAAPNKSFWTLSQIHTVINLVRERPIIYDKKHPEYKVNLKKEAAWDEISSILQTKTANECKRKWNTLRIQQRRILTKGHKRKDKRQVQWHCFELLQFLVPHMEWSISGEDSHKNEYSECEDENVISCEENEEQRIPLATDDTKYNIENAGNNYTNTAYSEIVSRIENQPCQALEEQTISSTLHPANVISISDTESINSSSFKNDQTIEINRRKMESSPVRTNCSNILYTVQSQQIEDKQNDQNNSLNYFLMDINMQMAKLNDLAQLELKIEIQKLLLEKLRSPKNLRHD